MYKYTCTLIYNYPLTQHTHINICSKNQHDQFNICCRHNNMSHKTTSNITLMNIEIEI